MTTLDFDDIIEQLTLADDAYFNSSVPETMSDAQYDRLKKQAFKLNPGHTYFAQIGSDVRGGKEKLPYSMGSLDQVYDGELLDWFKKYKLIGKRIVITDKLDGISCMLVYRDGQLEKAYSRGNGTFGADITRHVKLLTSVPKTLKDPVYMVVRGEIIMKNSRYEAKWKSKFKNPRVMVAGTMNRSVSELEQIADIDFIAYEIVATSGQADITKTRMLAHLDDNGFNIVEASLVLADTLDEAALTKYLKNARISSSYELDGLVITANELAQVQGQRNSVSLNPEHSCKYKVNDESSIVLATVVKVIWEISKSGYLKPRVEIQPVDLFGTTVTYATGFNGKFIRDNGIGTGATIKITKSGTVIPFIVEVVTPAPRTDLPDENVHGAWGWNDNDVEIVVADVDTNSIVRFKQVLDFVEKLNVDLLRESSLSKLFDTFKLWDKDYSEIIVTILDLKKREWEAAIGSNGGKSYDSLHRRLQAMELHTLIGATKFMGIGFGVRKAKNLIAGSNGADLWSLNAVDIAMMDGFDTKTAGSVAKGLIETKAFIDQLESSGYLSFVTVSKTNELSSLNVVMTGFRDADLSAEIERRGGKIGSGVSSKTTHLLTFDPSSNSGKMKKAKDLGVKCMTPDDFKDEFNL